jgi:hypothetical protein
MKNPFAFLFARSRRDQFLAQYVIREVRRGRALSDVVEDPYVVNRSTSDERARLLEQPDLVEAVGTHAIADLRATVAGSRSAT